MHASSTPQWTIAVAVAWCVSLGLLSAASHSAAQQLPQEVRALFSQLNDDKVQFNDGLLVLGKEDAKVTAVLFYAALCLDSEAFINEVLPAVRKDYIDTGKLRLIFYDYPLNWKDMQAFAGLRCLPKDKHLDALIRAADTGRARIMRKTQFSSVAGNYDSVLTRFGISSEQAIRCMRNSELLGFVEGQRRLAVEQWEIMTTPTLLIGDQKFTDIASKGKFYDVMQQFVQ